jgi:sugar lactone lactonase YvrE
MAIEYLAMTGDRCGEGAVWSAAEQVLYWADINRFLVHRYDPASRAVRSWRFAEPVVAVALTRTADVLLLALGSRLMLWKPATDARRELSFRLPDYRRVRLNDGRPDPSGRFWVGSMENNVLPDGELDPEVEGHFQKPGLGKLFRFDADGSVAVMRSDIGISNTVCWSPDGRTFYFGDSLANEIRAYDHDAASGAISNGRPFFAGFERGGPDGSTVDAEGYLWNCRFGGGCVVRVAPDGKVDRVIELPCADITTCTFGGADLCTLFITSAGMRRHPGERLAGSLFALRTDVPGLPENQAALP